MENLPLLKPTPKRANGTPIQELRITPENFLNRSCVAYGKSNSGKSTVIRNIVECLRRYVEMAFVFSAMEDQNDTYKDIIHNSAIDTDVSQAHVHQWIKEFWARQKIATQIYRKATASDVLLKLYKSVADSRNNARLEKVNRYARRISSAFDKLIESKPPLERGYYQEEKKAVMDNLAQMQIEFYRRVIKKHLHSIIKRKLTNDEEYCIEYIGFRPHVLLIFDDCVHTFTKKFQSSAEFRDLFVAGRHNCITVVLAAHLRSNLEKTINENVSRSIFCTQQIASNAAERMDSTCVEEVKEFKSCIRAVYHPNEPFRKLVYIANCPDPFRWIKARYIPFESDESKREYIGSRYFVRVCKAAAPVNDIFDSTNPFVECFELKNVRAHKKRKRSAN